MKLTPPLIALAALATAASLASAQDDPANDPAIDPNRDPAPEVVVQTNSGSRIRGVIVGQDETSILLDSADFGEIRIPRSQIARDDLPASTPLSAKLKEVDVPPPGLFGTSFLDGFDKSIGLGFSGKSGDTDEFSVNASAFARYSDDIKRWRFSAFYNYGTVENVETKDDGYANLRRDWLLPDQPTFFWSEGRADYNSFQAYRLRVGGFGGIGYTFFDDEENPSLYDRSDFALVGRVGAGGSYEFGDINEFTAEAVLAVEGTWQVTEGQTLAFINTYFPSLDDLEEGRNVTEASYTIALDRGEKLNLKFGIYNEYLSETEDDSSHNSLNYFGQLVYEF